MTDGWTYAFDPDELKFPAEGGGYVPACDLCSDDRPATATVTYKVGPTGAEILGFIREYNPDIDIQAFIQNPGKYRKKLIDLMDMAIGLPVQATSMCYDCSSAYTKRGTARDMLGDEVIPGSVNIHIHGLPADHNLIDDEEIAVRRDLNEQVATVKTEVTDDDREEATRIDVE